MIYPLAATSQSIDIQIVDDSGLPVTGLVAATFPTLTYSLAGANADGAFPALSDLALITTAYASGGVKERGNGVYRLDLPNGVFTTAGEVRIRGEATGKHVLAPWIDVAPVVTLPAIPASWITAASIAASALNGKGDWNTVTPPSAQAIANAVAANGGTAVTVFTSGKQGASLIPTTVVNMAMTQGEDKTFVDPIVQADGISPQNVTGWTAQLVVHKVGDPSTVFLTKSCTLIAIANSQFPNALQAIVASADTANMLPGQYGHYWQRTDSGNDTFVSEGLFSLMGA